MVNSAAGTELAIADVDHDFGVVTTPDSVMSPLGANSNKPSEMKFEQRRTASSTSTKIMHSDGYSAEEATANASHSRRVQADGVHYEESGQAAAMKARLEMDGVTAEKAAAVKQVTMLIPPPTPFPRRATLPRERRDKKLPISLLVGARSRVTLSQTGELLKVEGAVEIDAFAGRPGRSNQV